MENSNQNLRTKKECTKWMLYEDMSDEKLKLIIIINSNFFFYSTLLTVLTTLINFKKKKI